VIAIALVGVLGVAAAIGGLAGCAGASSGSGSSANASGAAAGLPTVSGDFGTKPAITIPEGDPPSSLRTTVLHQGSGPAVTKGQLVAVDYLGVVWKTGKVFDTSFQDGHSPAAFTVGTGQVIDGFDQGLLGQKVGSRVLLVIPPAQGYGSQGNSSAGIAGTDTIVFVVDLLGAHDATESADGSKAAPLPATLPAVSTAKGRPTVTIPAGVKPPTKLVTATVLQGSGEEVKSGDLVIVQYVGVKWADGKTFDASWDHGAPSGFPIGLGQVIPGWDKGLVGRHVGDRVLLVVPPAEGYGAQGQSQAGISGTDTLVFAVDIVGTYH
jgi:FKBP-type peptidyl-prolyl cis-trans isomerase